MGILKKATVNDEGEIGNEVLCLTLAHYLADWPHWLMSASSPPVPEGRALLLQSVQLLSASGAAAAAAAAAPLRHPPPLHYRASPSLGPHFRCHSLHLRCRPPILKIKGLLWELWTGRGHGINVSCLFPHSVLFWVYILTFQNAYKACRYYQKYPSILNMDYCAFRAQAIINSPSFHWVPEALCDFVYWPASLEEMLWVHCVSPFPWRTADSNYTFHYIWEVVFPSRKSLIWGTETGKLKKMF